MIQMAKPIMGAEEKQAVLEVLDSGIIAQGPRTKAFEEAFAAFCGAAHCVALNSGTSALHVAMKLLGIGPGDEVITTPITWAATVNMIEVLGGVPVYVDVHRDTLQLDERQLYKALSPRTVGIIPVHYAGAPCNLRLRIPGETVIGGHTIV